MRLISVSRPGIRAGLSFSHSSSTKSGVVVGPILQPNRVADAAQELDVRAVELPGALADPQHVRRAVVPPAAQRVLAGERLLVAEQQGLVAGVEVDLVEVVVVLGVDAAGTHEPQGPIDLCSHLVVGPALGARCHELLRPGVDTGEIGEAALGERTQQVERRCRLVVGLHEPVGRGDPRRFGGGRVVHHVAAERRQVEIADAFERSRPWLGELTGDAPDLDHRYAERIGEDDGHLQDDAQLLSDVDRRELLEALGAVAGLQHEGVAGGDVAERGLQRTRLAGEHQRGIGGDLLQGPIEVALVGPIGLLFSRKRLPRRRGPRLCHGGNANETGLQMSPT